MHSVTATVKPIDLLMDLKKQMDSAMEMRLAISTGWQNLKEIEMAMHSAIHLG